MTRNKNTPPNNFESFEPLSPQTAFLLVKGAQNFAHKLLNQPQSQEGAWTIAYHRDMVPGEPYNEKSTAPYAKYFELQYSVTDEFLGSLKDWDAHLFSFKDSASKPHSLIDQLFITLPLEPVDYPALEVGYWASTGEFGSKSGVEVHVPFEGPAKIKDLIYVDKGNGIQGFEGQWRPMADTEGMHLITDINDITERLHDHIANRKPLIH